MIPFIGPANRALAGFGGILYGLPNPEILLAPLRTQEAVLSSQIEGTQTTLGEVFLFEAGEVPPTPRQQDDIREVLNYRAALHHAENELSRKPFHLNRLLKLHEILLDSVRGENKSRGRFRTAQNWIGASGAPMERAFFVPPEARLLPEALDNWEKYYHADDRDSLVQLAVIHAQLEILHPFLDGNGRLGRILIPLYLFEHGLLSRPVFYLSAYLEKHRAEYIARLNAIGKEADGWERWIAFFLESVRQQADLNLRVAREIITLYERLKIRVMELTHSQHALPILDAFFERPILSAAELTRRPDAPSRQTVATLLSRLQAAGILVESAKSRGRRAQVLMLPELVEICERATP